MTSFVSQLKKDWFFGVEALWQWIKKGYEIKTRQELQDHMIGTYFSVRIAMAVISFLFAPFLWFIGQFWYNIPLQNSMSSYYFAGSSEPGPIRSLFVYINDVIPSQFLLDFLANLDGPAPMRSWFVGALFVLGILLYLYKGFSRWESWLLSVAGLAAVMVAIFPMQWDCGDSCQFITAHGIFAIVTFVCMTIVARFPSKDMLHRLSEERKNFYGRLYNLTGFAMLVFPFLVFVFSDIIGDNSRLIFFLELGGIWSFSSYWYIKSLELKESNAEPDALEKKASV